MKNNPASTHEFIRSFEKWAADVLSPAQAVLRSIFTEWKSSDYWRNYSATRQPIPTPIHRTHSRLKRPESVADKILRKPESFPEGLSLNSLQRLTDALGGRIITYFTSGLPIMDNAIRNHPMIELAEEHPPVAYLDTTIARRLGLSHLNNDHKESGYSSVHYIVRLKHKALNDNSPLVEIQVRTLTLDVWGEIEHVLGYKPNKRTSASVQTQFQLIARQLAIVDEMFDMLYQEQMRYRAEAEIDDVDLLNAENLPAVLELLALSCSQREIDGLLKLLASRGVQTVGEFRRGASKDKVEVIRNTFRSFEGREPSDFEIIASVAAITGLVGHGDMQKMVEAQIQFLRTWENLKSVRETAIKAPSS